MVTASTRIDRLGYFDGVIMSITFAKQAFGLFDVDSTCPVRCMPLPCANLVGPGPAYVCIKEVIPDYRKYRNFDKSSSYDSHHQSRHVFPMGRPSNVTRVLQAG